MFSLFYDLTTFYIMKHPHAALIVGSSLIDISLPIFVNGMHGFNIIKRTDKILKDNLLDQLYEIEGWMKQ